MAKRPKKIENNEDLVQDLMVYSPRGALGQVFIVEAIRKYADGVAAWTDEQVAEFQKTNGFISMEGWRETARDVKKRCDAFYNR